MRRRNKKSMFWILVKKQINERFSFLKKGKNSFDILGFFLSILLTVTIVSVFISVFSHFIVMYCDIKYQGVLDIQARQYELLSISYFVILIGGIFGGVHSIHNTIFESEDLKILVGLPVSSVDLFCSKLAFIYLKKIVSAFFIILPLNLTFAIVTSQTLYYFVLTIVMCFTFPLITLAISSLFALPTYLIKKKVQSKYLLTFIIITVITSLLFLCYSQFLEALKELMVTGKIQFLFSESLMSFIHTVSEYLLPTSLFAHILLRQNIFWNSVLLISIFILSIYLSVILIQKLLIHASQERISNSSQKRIHKKSSIKQKKAFYSLIAKEFNLIFRTPSYAFQYFSIAIIMPIMVYLCMVTGTSLLKSLVFINCTNELAIFITLILGVLTNTFCATNISREGPMFYAVKAMPLKCKQIIFSKVLFCMIVSFLSILITCVVLVMNFISIEVGIFLFVVASFFSFAQICLATKMDFNKPTFSSEEDGEIKESSITISSILVIGLTLVSLVGLFMISFALYDGVIGSGQTGRLVAYLSCGGISILIASLSYWYLMHRLEEKYYRFSEDNL